MPVVRCLWYVVKDGCKFKLKIQGNIEEQSLDVKGLVVLPLGEIFKFSRQGAKDNNILVTLRLCERKFLVNHDMHNCFEVTLPTTGSVLLNPTK